MGIHLGFYPTRRGLVMPPPRRNNQTNKGQRDPARAGRVATGRTRGQPTCRRPTATTGRGSLALGYLKAPSSYHHHRLLQIVVEVSASIHPLPVT